MKKTLDAAESRSKVTSRTTAIFIVEKLNYFFYQFDQFFGVLFVLSLIAKFPPSPSMFHGYRTTDPLPVWLPAFSATC